MNKFCAINANNNNEYVHAKTLVAFDRLRF